MKIKNKMHESFVLHISGYDDDTMLRNKLRWYYDNEYRKLVVKIILDDQSSASMDKLASIINSIRILNTGIKQNPDIVIHVNIDELSKQCINDIDKLDTASPRIVMVITIDDKYDFNNFEASYLKTLDQVTHNKIEYYTMFYIRNEAENIDVLRRKLNHIKNSNEALGRVIFNHSPIVEVDYKISCDDNEELINRISDLWLDLPEINDSINMSLGGYFKELFICKERFFWKNLKIRGRNIKKEANIRGNSNDDNALYQIVENKLSEFNLYEAFQHRSNNVVLDNDWDFAFDSYVCQSPILANKQISGGSK